MSDLVEFLRARLDEDETETVKAAGYAHEWKTTGAWAWESYADHHNVQISYQRMLAEVESKRRIIEIAAERLSEVEGYAIDGGMEQSPNFGGLILRLLAQPYADHEAFQPEWRVS